MAGTFVGTRIFQMILYVLFLLVTVGKSSSTINKLCQGGNRLKLNDDGTGFELIRISPVTVRDPSF